MSIVNAIRRVKTVDILFALLVFTIPLSLALPNILLLILVIHYIIKEKQKTINNYTKLAIVFIAFFLVKALFNRDIIEGFFFYKHLVTFLVITILAFNIKDIDLVKRGFVFGVLIAIIFTTYQLILYYINYKSIPLGNSSEVADLLIIHRPYFGFVCFLGIICCTDLSISIKEKKYLYFYRFLILLFTLFIYLIVARLALILVIIYLFILVIQRIQVSTKKLLLLIGIFFSLILLLVSNNKNLQKRLHIQNSFKETISVISNQEPRVVIWNCAFDLINNTKFNNFIGYRNIKNLQLDLNDCYSETIENTSKKEYYLDVKFNTHNQFLDFYLQGGIIGLALFLSIMGYSLFITKSNYFSLLALVGFLLFLMVENLFHRQLGVYLLGIFIPLFIKKSLLLKKWK